MSEPSQGTGRTRASAISVRFRNSCREIDSRHLTSEIDLWDPQRRMLLPQAPTIPRKFPCPLKLVAMQADVSCFLIHWPHILGLKNTLHVKRNKVFTDNLWGLAVLLGVFQPRLSSFWVHKLLFLKTADFRRVAMKKYD